MIFLLILHFIHSWSILSCTKVSFCCSEIKKSQTNFMWNTLAGIKQCDALNCFISVDSLNEKNCCWETFKTVDSLRKGAAGDLRLFCWVWLTFRWKRVLRYMLTVTAVPNLHPQSSNLEYAVWIFHTRYSLLIIFIVWTFWNAVLFHDDAIFINSITGIFLYGPFAVFSIFRELL